MRTASQMGTAGCLPGAGLRSSRLCGPLLCLLQRSLLSLHAKVSLPGVCHAAVSMMSIASLGQISVVR